MKINSVRTAMVSLVAVAVIAAGATAFAGKGMGYRGDDQRDGGYGSHHRRAGYACAQMKANLTPEQQEQVEAERLEFFNTTKGERQDLYAKRLELKAEMAKRQPDVQKASALQKEISDLQGSLDQKRLSHIMGLRDINPDAGRGFMMEGGGMGYHGKGRGMGSGSRDCPYQ